MPHKRIIFFFFLFINSSAFSMLQEKEIEMNNIGVISKTIPLALDHKLDNDSSHSSNTENLYLLEEDSELQSPDPLSIDQDRTPLLDEDIKAYIRKHIINGDEVCESPKRKLLRQILTAGVIVVGLSSGLPYINSSCSAAEGVLPLCIAFSGGNIIASGTTAVWVGLLHMNNLKPMSDEELRVTKTSNRNLLRRYLLSATFGLLSCFADVYAVYKYNTGAYKLLAIQAFAIDYIYKTEGYYKLLEYVSEWRSSIAPGALKLSQTIKKRIIPYILNNPADALAKVADEEELFKLLTNPPKADAHDVSFKDPDLCLQGIPKRTFKISSLWFPISNFFINSLLAYEALRKFGAPQIVSIITSPVFVLPSFVLDVFAISMNSADSVFDAAHNSLLCQRNQNRFLDKHYSKLSYVLPVSALILSALSAAGDAYIVSDTVKDSIFHSLGIIAPLSVYATTTIFETFATNTLFKDFSQTVIYKYGSELNRKIIRCITEFEKLSEILLISKPNSEAEVLEESSVWQKKINEDSEIRATSNLNLGKALLRNICPLIPLTSCFLVCIIIMLVSI